MQVDINLEHATLLFPEGTRIRFARASQTPEALLFHLLLRSRLRQTITEVRAL